MIRIKPRVFAREARDHHSRSHGGGTCRQQLTMTYQSVLPKPIKDLSEYMDVV